MWNLSERACSLVNPVEGGRSPWGLRPRVETVRPDAEIINADHPRYQFHRFILKFWPTLKFILTALWKWGRSNPKNSNSWQLIVGHLLLRSNFCLLRWNFVPAQLWGHVWHIADFGITYIYKAGREGRGAPLQTKCTTYFFDGLPCRGLFFWSAFCYYLLFQCLSHPSLLLRI